MNTPEQSVNGLVDKHLGDNRYRMVRARFDPTIGEVLFSILLVPPVGHELQVTSEGSVPEVLVHALEPRRGD